LLRSARKKRLRQALGRLPWLAPFFLRARRLRPVLPMVSSSTRNHARSARVTAIVANQGRSLLIDPLPPHDTPRIGMRK
jgi:hypothetical protein